VPQKWEEVMGKYHQLLARGVSNSNHLQEQEDLRAFTAIREQGAVVKP
jgi:hypothetical protein